MASTQPLTTLGGLARRLVEDGLLSEEAARRAHEEAQRKRLPLVTALVATGEVGAREVASAASREFGVPLLDISVIDLEQAPVKLVDEKLIRQHKALPLYKRGNRLFVAVSDPTNLGALDEIKFHTNLTTEPVLVEDDKLEQAIDRALEAHDTTLQDFGDVDLEKLDVSGVDEEEDSGQVTAADAEDAPVVRFVNKILVDAIKKGASDIHFEPYEKAYRVRYRQDGILYEVASPPHNLAPRITARLKVMARLDIAERRVPQDGRIKLSLSRNQAIDFRVNTLPTLYGEKVVLRILDSSQAKVGIDSLGMEEEQKEAFLSAIRKPWGMVLVTGPTGSGKTVTLYTALNILNTPERNISTVEDPVEIFVPGINQVQMNPKTGMTFAEALRAFLRQDPDIIMVGEIRDLETAEIAIKAAQTGHMVLSTLHTNDAPQTLTRLANMGVPPYNIASAVTLIVAQRLARRLCTHCRKPAEYPAEVLAAAGFDEAEIPTLKIFQPGPGCDHCTNGYRGRVGIFQVMPVSEEMGRIILEGGTAMDLAEQARKEGIADLRTSGLRKVREGITSLEEIDRVTRD